VVALASDPPQSSAQDSRSPGQMPGGALQLVTGLQFQAHGCECLSLVPTEQRRDQHEHDTWHFAAASGELGRWGDRSGQRPAPPGAGSGLVSGLTSVSNDLHESEIFWGRLRCKRCGIRSSCEAGVPAVEVVGELVVEDLGAYLQ